MSIEDLEGAGLLRPRDEWGQAQPHTRVSKTPVVASGVVAVASGVMMYVGGGGVVTWIGLALFFVALGGFTWSSLQGIRRDPDS